MDEPVDFVSDVYEIKKNLGFHFNTASLIGAPISVLSELSWSSLSYNYNPYSKASTSNKE